MSVITRTEVRWVTEHRKSDMAFHFSPLYFPFSFSLPPFSDLLFASLSGSLYTSLSLSLFLLLSPFLLSLSLLSLYAGCGSPDDRRPRSVGGVAAPADRVILEKRGKLQDCRQRNLYLVPR